MRWQGWPDNRRRYWQSATGRQKKAERLIPTAR